MTPRQLFLKSVYPFWMLLSKFSRKNNVKILRRNITAPVSFYTLTCYSNNGELIDFNVFKGKKVLLVNTASDCGYTCQYKGLEKLYRQYKDKLVVLGFPSNDFKEQEKKSDEEIAQFCKINFEVSFPLISKSVVVKSDLQNPVFQWLTNAGKNGWCNQQPSWNFSKYLVDEEGKLIGYFGPSVSPENPAIIKAIL